MWSYKKSFSAEDIHSKSGKGFNAFVPERGGTDTNYNGRREGCATFWEYNRKLLLNCTHYDGKNNDFSPQTGKKLRNRPKWVNNL